MRAHHSRGVHRNPAGIPKEQPVFAGAIGPRRAVLKGRSFNRRSSIPAADRAQHRINSERQVHVLSGKYFIAAAPEFRIEYGPRSAPESRSMPAARLGGNCEERARGPMSDISKRLEKAEKYLQKGKTESALEEYLGILHDDPGNDLVRQSAAELCVNLGRNQEAAQFLGTLFDKQAGVN